jgi:hypothetical protein
MLQEKAFQPKRDEVCRNTGYCYGESGLTEIFFRVRLRWAKYVARTAKAEHLVSNISSAAMESADLSDTI